MLELLGLSVYNHNANNVFYSGYLSLDTTNGDWNRLIININLRFVSLCGF